MSTYEAKAEVAMRAYTTWLATSKDVLGHMRPRRESPEDRDAIEQARQQLREAGEVPTWNR